MSPHCSVASSRARRLRRGINLSHWFSQIYWPPGYDAAHFDTYVTRADMALIRDIGFDHVRLPINCEPIIAAASRLGLPADYLARLRSRIGELLDHGLSVIIDIHPEDGFKRSLADSDDAVATFIEFWQRFAAAFADLSPERVFFEVLNEPCINNPTRWNRIQAEAVRAVRKVVPQHTLIICGDQWSQLPELMNVIPPNDDNLIANFHLYDPSCFTHQGAGWLPPWALSTKGLHYPATPERVADLLATVTDTDARRHLQEYAATGWNRDVYRTFIQPAIDWADRHGLPLLCNEFGVYKKFTPRASRLAWLRDVTAILSSENIGWTMWDYAGDFSIVTQKDGIRIPHTDLIVAVGLTGGFPPAAKDASPHPQSPQADL